MINIEGWISLHRKLLESTVFQNADLLKVWVWCLLKATHRDYEVLVGLQMVKLHAGQFITGRNKGAEELKLKPSTFRDYLKVLARMGMISLSPDNKKTVVTVENWGKYQAEEGRSRQLVDINLPAIQPQNDTNNNSNNKKNNNNDVYAFLEEQWGMLIGLSLADDVDHLIHEYGEDRVKNGIEICKEKNVRTGRYLNAVVRNVRRRKEGAHDKSRGVDAEAAWLKEQGIGF